MFAGKGQPLSAPNETQTQRQTLSSEDMAPPVGAAPDVAFQVLVLLALLGPFIVFFLMPGAGLIAPKSAFLGLLLCLAGVISIFLLVVKLGDTGSAPQAKPYMLMPEEQPQAVKDVMDVRVATTNGTVQHFYGPLSMEADKAFKHLQEELSSSRTVAALQKDDELGAHITLTPLTVQRGLCSC